MKKFTALFSALSLILLISISAGAEDAAASDTSSQAPVVTSEQTTVATPPEQTTAAVTPAAADTASTPVSTPVAGTSTTAEVSKDAAPAAAEAKTDANDAEKAAFKSSYNSYVSYYSSTYVPAYKAYNASLTALQNKIKAANITTDEQLKTIESFVNGLKTSHHNFFGTRASDGKSRYIVPYLRNAMTAAVKSKDYASAGTLCSSLTDAIHARVSFLASEKVKIDGFEIPAAVTTGVAKVSFNVTNFSQWYYEFNIVLTNPTDSDITKWNLAFNYNGEINTIWCDGSGITFRNLGNNRFSVVPNDIWQAAYTIPAHSSVTLKGNGNKLGTTVTNAIFSDNSVTMAFNK